MFLPQTGVGVRIAGTLITLLGLVPTIAFIIGLYRGGRRALRDPAGADTPLLALVALSVAGYVLFTWGNPWFASVKGSYLLGIAVPFAWYASETLEEWMGGPAMAGPGVGRRARRAGSRGRAHLHVWSRLREVGRVPGSRVEESRRFMSQVRQKIKWVLPFVVSGGLLAYQFSTIDMSGILRHVTGAAGAIFIPVLVFYGLFSLWIEALSLRIPMRDWHHDVSMWTLARIKAASYLLYIVHYILGAGALSILLRKRAGATVWEAGGVVFLVALFDMGMLILFTLIAAGFMTADTLAVRGGLLGGAAFLLVSGFVVLRTPRPLGPLDKLRDLSVFRAARTAPLRQLVELGLLRFVFVMAFMSVCGAALWAFDIHPPLFESVVNIAIVAIVATLPIAVAGLGTSQAAFIEVFKEYAEPGVLLACSLTLSAGLIILRAGFGFAFAFEFVREAIEARHEEVESA